MTQTSRLVLEIDSRDAEQKAADVRKALDALESAGLSIKPAMDTAGKGLDGLNESGKKAESTATRLGRAWAEATSGIQSNTQQIVKELQALNAKQDASTKAFDSIVVSLNKVSSSLVSTSSSMGGLSSANAKTEASTRKASAALDDQQKEIADLLGSIDPLTRRLNELERQEQALNKARKSGKIELDTYNEYSTKLAATRAELGRFNESMGKTGISAKQTAAALRGVPAQFTDIAVSLQGGQAPLTVFLQQGGQLKDMFGGAGPAAKALAGYVVGLINPFTVAAAAAGALGLAYFQGSKEADAYRNALIGNGNAAGTTAGAMASLAASIGSTVGTTGEAAQALALLAENGKIARGSFEEIATAAVASQEATGKAVSETISEFAKIAEDPVKAAKSLNDQYNFLTAAVYSQIVALKEQGRETDAAKLLTDTYAEAVRSRATQVTTNLGTIERAWASISLETRKTIDAALNVGRIEDSAKRITDLTQKVAAAQAAINADPDDRDNRKKLDESKQELTFLVQQRDTQAAIAAAQGLTAENQRKGIDATAEFNAQLKSGANNAEKRAEAIKQLNMQIAAAAKAGSPIADKDIARRLADINEQYKDPAVKKELQYREEAGIKALDQARQQYAVLQQQSAAISNQNGEVGKLGAAAQALTKWEQELADIKEKKTLTADQKSLLANQDLITAQLKRNAGLEKQNDLTTIALGNSAKLLAFQENLNSQLDTARTGLSNQLAGMGLGQEGRKRLQEDLKIREDYQKQLTKLAYDYNKIVNPTSADKDLYDQETEKLKDALGQRLAAQKGYYTQLDRLTSDWTVGATAALQDYSDSAANISSQTYDLVTDGLRGIEDEFVNLATKGKFSFKDLADSIIADLARILAKTLIVQPLLSALFGGSAGGSGSAVGGIASSLFGGSGSQGGSGGGLVGTISSLGSTVYKLYSAVTGVGSSIASGYASGGLGGAFSGGVSYYSNLFSGLTNTLTSGFSGISSAIFGASASEVAASAATSAALQGAVGEGVASVGANLGLGGFAAEGAAAGATAAAGAGVSTGLYSQLAAMASNPVGWAIAAVTAAYQSGKLYDQGVRPDASAMLKSYSGSGAAGKAFGIPQTVGAKYFEAVDGVVGKLVGGKLAAMLSGSTLFQAVWSGIGSKLFGGAWQTKDQGVQLGVTGGGLDAYAYTDQKKKGGLFSSNKKRTRLNALDTGMQSELQDAFDARLDTVFSIFDTLNVDVPEAALDGLNMAAWKISLKDLTTDQVNQMFSDFFEVLGNEAVGAISKSMGLGLDTYNVDQLTEFVSNLYTINDTFNLLNINALPVSVWGGKLAEQYIALSGGMEAFNTATQTYYDAFFTDAEKSANTLTAVRKQFSDLNLTFPSTKEGFRSMVESIDSTTDAGRAMLLTLINLSGSASNAYSIMEQQADEAKAAAVAAAQAASQSLLDGAGTAYSALQRSIQAQQKALTTAYNDQVTAINASLTTANQQVSDLTSVSSGLDTALKQLRGTSEDSIKMLRAQATATLQAALAQARSGGTLADFPGLDDALSTVGSNTTDLYSSLQDFNRDQGRTANVVAELEAINGKQLTNAEQTVKTLQDQLDVAKDQYDAQTAQFDAQLDFAQAQIDALNGVDNSIMSVKDAVNAMNLAVVAALGTIKGATPTNSGTLIDTAYQNALGQNADAAGKAYWQGQLTNGSINYDQLAGAVKNAAAENAIKDAYSKILGHSADAAGAKYWADQVSSGALTVSQLQEAIANAAKANGTALKVPGYASGGNFGGGIRLVGERGPEIELTGSSRIISNRDAARALAGGGDGVIAELRALAVRMENIEANTQAGALNASNLLKVFNRVTDGGNAMLTKEVA